MHRASSSVIVAASRFANESAPPNLAQLGVEGRSESLRRKGAGGAKGRERDGGGFNWQGIIDFRASHGRIPRANVQVRVLARCTFNREERDHFSLVSRLCRDILSAGKNTHRGAALFFFFF